MKYSRFVTQYFKNTFYVPTGLRMPVPCSSNFFLFVDVSELLLKDLITWPEAAITLPVVSVSLFSNRIYRLSSNHFL